MSSTGRKLKGRRMPPAGPLAHLPARGQHGGRRLGIGERDPLDYYCTPAWAAQALLWHLPGWRPTLDPCAGTGAILAAAAGHHMHGIELDASLAGQAVRFHGLPVRYGDGLRRSWRGEHLLMNPPFARAEAFVQKAVREAASAAVLMRLGFLCAQRRRAFWQAHPPDLLAMLSKRPSFTGNGTDSADYCWACWGVQAAAPLVWLHPSDLEVPDV